MKAITLSISILFLTGCSFVKSTAGIPSFQPGDCIAMTRDVENLKKPLERWEKQSDRKLSMELIVEVGKEKYLTVADFAGYLRQSDSKISYDDIMTKVDCSDKLNQVKKELFK